MQKKNKLIIVARDTVNTGGGYVVEKLCTYLKNDFETIILFTDYSNPNITYKNIIQMTMPLGATLYKYKPRNKIMRIIRHFFQVFLFSIYSLRLLSPSFKDYIILDSNNEGLVCDISLTHDVFSMTYLKDIKQNSLKFYRIFNPILFYKIIKELIVLNKPSTKLIIAISKETLEEVNKINFTKKTKKIIGHGVDTKKFKPLCDLKLKKDLRKKYKIKNDAFVMLLSGHEYERKGLKYAVESLKYLPENIILVVTGGGDVSHYREYAINIGVTDRVLFLGLIDDIIEAYWLSDIFVLPTSYEGWGLVATEAMGSGLPVLICPVGGVKDYLINNTNGIFIERDSQDIVKKVLLVKNNSDIYQKLYANGLKTAEQYSWKKVAEKYNKVIYKIVKEKYA